MKHISLLPLAIILVFATGAYSAYSRNVGDCVPLPDPPALNRQRDLQLTLVPRFSDKQTVVQWRYQPDRNQPVYDGQSFIVNHQNDNVNIGNAGHKAIKRNIVTIHWVHPKDDRVEVTAYWLDWANGCKVYFPDKLKGFVIFDVFVTYFHL